VRVDVTRKNDVYVVMNGTERVLGADDMMMVLDGSGVISSVLHGPDQRPGITGHTQVLFAVYAPAGVGENSVRDHLEDIRANVLLVAPDAETELLATLSAA